jgi:hypothetical protein
VNAAIDILHNATKLSGVTYSDAATPTLSITYAQYVDTLTGPSSLAPLLPTGTTFNIRNAPANTTIATALQNDPLVATFAISDTAANFNAVAAALSLDSKWSGVDVQSPPVPNTIIVGGTAGADTVDFTGTSVPLAIDLKDNTAFVSAGLAAPSISFIGAPDAITLGTGTASINYLLAPHSGIETIANFQYGLDLLNIGLGGASPTVIRAVDTTLGGLHAISIYNADRPRPRCDPCRHARRPDSVGFSSATICCSPRPPPPSSDLPKLQRGRLGHHGAADFSNAALGLDRGGGPGGVRALCLVTRCRRREGQLDGARGGVRAALGGRRVGRAFVSWGGQDGATRRGGGGGPSWRRGRARGRW